MKWQSYLKLALQESRHARGRLAFCLFSIAMGVTALTSVHTIIFNFENGIRKEARNLMGADLTLRSRHPFPTDQAQKSLLADLHHEFQKKAPSQKLKYADLIQFYFMLYQKGQNKDGALASVLAIEKNFPFYGKVVTKPPRQWERLLQGSEPVLVIDAELLAKLKINVGAELFLGRNSFRVIGTIVNEKSTLLHGFQMAPGVYAHRSHIEKTGLIKTGSRIIYRRLYKSPSNFDIMSLKEWKKKNIVRAQKNHIEIRTYEEAASGLQRFFKRLRSFLTIVSLVILLLGALGVGSALNVFMKSRQDHVAIFRNLGLEPKQVFCIYFILAMLVGLGGSLLGAVPGSLLPFLLSQATGFQSLSKLLPFALEAGFSPQAFFHGILAGLGATLLFVLVPVYRLAHVSPLSVLRRDANWQQISSPLRRLLSFALIFVCIFIFCVALTASSLGSWENAFYLSAFLGLALGLLYLLSGLLTRLIGLLIPYISSYHLRQGITNLYRPHNQTNMLVSSLGAGFLLLALVSILEASIQQELGMQNKKDTPNHFILDVQPYQYKKVLKILKEYRAKNIQLSPMLTARILSINGKGIYEDQKNMELDSTEQSWAERLRSREHYLVFRDHLLHSERVTKGFFWQGKTTSQELSVEERWAKNMKVAIGDTISFDIQGIPLKAKISSLRRIHWQSMQPNSMLLLSPGRVEKVPHIYIGSYRITDKAARLKLQEALLASAPNVSMINLDDIMSSLFQITEQISLLMRFLALLTLFNGGIVFVGAVFASRFVRLREAMLLKVLGASPKDIYRILLSEYAILTFLACLCGLLLTGLSSYYLIDSFLKIFPVIPYDYLAMLVFSLLFLSLFLSLPLSREVARTSPLSILSEESG